MASIRNILLDRDGTIIYDRHYLHDPNQVELIPGAGQALKELAAQGYRLFLVTNQSGIGRGYYSEADFWRVQKRLDNLLWDFTVSFEDVRFCPHQPEDACPCRKPGTGMWDQLVRKFHLPAEETVMIGDKSADIEFGIQASLAATVLVLTGHGQKEAQALQLPPLTDSWRKIQERTPVQPHVVAQDIQAAVHWLLTAFG